MLRTVSDAPPQTTHTHTWLCGVYAENKLSNLLYDYGNRLLLCNSKLVNVCYVDAEFRGPVSHVKPQSHAGSAADPAGPSDRGCRGPWTDSSVSKDTVATLRTSDS